MLHKNLWAPWRMAYMQQLSAELQQQEPIKTDKPVCFLCQAAQAQQEQVKDSLVIHQTAKAVVLLNRYPYTNGHVLIAPHQHVGSLGDLDADCRGEIMELTELCERHLRQAMNCQGVNVGMNLGRCAGAGVPGHLHVHVLPRWEGDTNFMQTVGGVRVLPQALEASYDHLVKVMSKLK